MSITDFKNFCSFFQTFWSIPVCFLAFFHNHWLIIPSPKQSMEITISFPEGKEQKSNLLPLFILGAAHKKFPNLPLSRGTEDPPHSRGLLPPTSKGGRQHRGQGECMHFDGFPHPVPALDPTPFVRLHFNTVEQASMMLIQSLLKTPKTGLGELLDS